MGTLRTTVLLFLLCCAVEQNNAVPIPAEPTAMFPETEIYTETYTEVVTDTVLSSDTEGARQKRQKQPLTGTGGENDARGGDIDTLPVSDTDVMSDGTLLTSSKEDSSEGDRIVDGENDTHGSPHDAVNTTAESTESTLQVLSAMPHNTSSIPVSTSSMHVSSSVTPQGSASKVFVRPHHSTPSMAGVQHHKTESPQSTTTRVSVTPQQDHDSNRNYVSPTPDGLDLTLKHSTPSPVLHLSTAGTASRDLTPGHSEPSATLHNFTQSTSGILLYRTTSGPRTQHDKSVNSEITPSLQTEIYTEIVERTELVISDTDSKSEETMPPHDPTSSTPILVSTISHGRTDSIQQSTSSTLPHSTAKLLEFADRMDMTPQDTRSTPNIKTSATGDTNLTPDNSDITPTPFDPSSSASALTPTEGILIASASEPSIIHHTSTSPTVDSSGKSITQSLEPVETEIYTEIMAITEMVMPDGESQSDDTLSAPDQEGSGQRNVIGNAELGTGSRSSPADRTQSTPSATSSISPQESTSSTPVRSSATPQDTTVQPVASYPANSTSQKATAALDDTNATPDGLDETPKHLDPTSTMHSLTPTERQILHHGNVTTPGVKLQLTSAPEENDDSDTTPKDSINPSSTTAESIINEPVNTRYTASTTKGTPMGLQFTPSQEPFVTEIYTETMEITELLTSDEKD